MGIDTLLGLAALATAELGVHRSPLVQGPSLVHGERGSQPTRTCTQYFWEIYNDLSRGHPKWWFSKGSPIVSSRHRGRVTFTAPSSGAEVRRKGSPQNGLKSGLWT